MSTTVTKSPETKQSRIPVAAARVMEGEQQGLNAPPGSSASPNNSEKLHTNRQVKGAAVAAGVTGLVLLGPAAGLLAAGGAALATTSGKGKVGKAARATGDSISDLGKSAKKFDQKHSVTEKASKGLVKGCNWISKKLNKDKTPNTQP